MSFTDPKKIWTTVRALIDADLPRAQNRARINSVFNGDAPYTEGEADANHISTNVNFLEGTQLIQRARSQFSNAFLKSENFFTVSLDFGPREKRSQWGKIITRNLNKIMKRSQRYYHVQESKFAGVVLHGVGPCLWFRDRDWCPRAMGIEDVLVPSKTTTDLDNLDHFAIHQTFTAAQLIRQTMGKGVDPGWNMKLVRQALAKMTKVQEMGMTNYDDNWLFPEKAVEDWKSNSTYWASDAVPVLHAYDVYYLDTSDSKKDPVWRRKIVIDEMSNTLGLETATDSSAGLLYDGKNKSLGTDISQILHVQFADGSVVPPFRYHSVRSLGYQLYAVCHLSNRLNCKLNDAIFESMLWYFRNASVGDEEKLEKIDLHHLGIIPQGLSWVQPNERHQVDYNLVSAGLQLNRQKMQEHASTYIRDTDSAGKEPETATAVMARVTTSSALISSMLNRAYTYQTYEYREDLRRFCVLSHPDCKTFREKCEAEGVPKEAWSRWKDMDVMPERTLGSGNKMLAVAQADRLMAVRPALDPDAQRRVLHMYVEENSEDPLLANELVPLEGPENTIGESFATLAWGTLIDAKPVVVPRGISRVDYVSTLIAFLAQDIQRINADGGTPDMERIRGLANVVSHLGEQVQILAEDEGLNQQVKAFSDILGKAQNELKGYAQRLQEAMEAEAENQMDPVTMAKIQGEIAITQAKLDAMNATAQTKQQIAQGKFVADQQRKNAQLAGNEQRKNIQLAGDQTRQGSRLQSDLIQQSVETRADIEALDAKTAATVAAKNEKNGSEE